MTDTRYQADLLIEFAESVYRTLGVPLEDARLCADSLVRSDLRGHPSHGIFRLPWYARRLLEGTMVPETRLETVSDAGTILVLDAGHGIGQVAATRAMQLAIDRAMRHGVGVVGVRRSNHFGAAMHYTLMAPPRGCIGILATNASPAIAPWGSIEKVIGNNPWSIAAPAGSRPPLVLDIANTMVARGKIYQALQRGSQIPTGWAIDRAGNPTTDPAEALAGLVLPIGGHKGYAIAFMIDVLAGVLTGSSFASQVSPAFEAGKESGCGHLAIALDVSRFLPLEEFNRRVEDLIRAVKAAPLAPGVEEVYYPGEPEARAEEANLQRGVSLPRKTIEDLTRLAEEIGVRAPFSRDSERPTA